MHVDALAAAHCSDHVHSLDPDPGHDHALVPDPAPARYWQQLAWALWLASCLAGGFCRCCASARCARLGSEEEGSITWGTKDDLTSLTSCCLALAVYGSLYGLGEAFSLRRRMLQRCKKDRGLVHMEYSPTHTGLAKNKAQQSVRSFWVGDKGWWGVTDGGVGITNVRLKGMLCIRSKSPTESRNRKTKHKSKMI